MSQPRRDWSDANEKRDRGCVVCGRHPVELAHTIGRKHDERRGSKLYVHPDSVVPLCSDHHRQYVGGPPSPEFSEWLMGFPIGWTDLEPSEMPSSLRSPSGSGDAS